jgi:hypothetical protein
MSAFTDRFKTRPLSHSQLGSWEWDKEQWYNNYILGIREPATPAMEFGNVVGDSIGTPNSLVPALTPPGVKEYKLTGNIGDIHMIGFADHYCDKTLVLHENKTSDNPNRWNQKKVDEHPQLTMYLLLLFLSEKIKPEQVKLYLNFIPVERGGDMLYRVPNPPVFKQFTTHRNGVDLLKYSQYVTDTVKAMEQYVYDRT